MASKLLFHDGQNLSATTLQGHFRGLAWGLQDSFPIIVGNGGRVVKFLQDKPIVLDSGTRHNLRAVSVNPKDGRALIVGNVGTAFLLEEERFTKVMLPTFENLRAVAWNHDGSAALLAGNNGTLLKLLRGEILPVDAGRANLRDISWRPKSENALIASNCFAEEFIPSPNLFDYEAETNIVKPLNEGRVDLIGVSWKESGDSALVVGYDVVWHTGFIGNFRDTALSPVLFENKRIYPVAVSWKPFTNLAAIATATAQPGVAKGALLIWDGNSLNRVFADDEFFFSHVAFDWKGQRLAALASQETRTFNV